MQFPKAIFFYIFISGILPLSAANGPEFPIGSVIQNFALPQTDASGRKTAVVHGKRATVVSPNQLKIEDLKVELFNSEGTIETTITATRSDFWRKSTRKHQTLAVRIVPRARSPASTRRLQVCAEHAWPRRGGNRCGRACPRPR